MEFIIVTSQKPRHFRLQRGKPLLGKGSPFPLMSTLRETAKEELSDRNGKYVIRYGGLGPVRARRSGIAAWGHATQDGKLVAGASGDHDCTYMVTVVAFPQTGNAFVYTPFSAIGDVPEVGQVFMMGHPGMNNKGLAYIEHGGEMRMIEPKEDWGYGIRKGTSVFHVLRFANNAREALEMELSFPVGDVGQPMGSVGGFYADSSYGYVLESRSNPVIIRETGLMGETDFLYANNIAMHPEAWVWRASCSSHPSPLRSRWLPR